ncbi:MAG: pantetheine-phosphate adenylyltransferase [Planctomycetota bacterium]|nr:pantetheine-phosphate adenylyltransferase [Planctomycetota bacterium]
MSDERIHRAIYTGSFDPITLGHLDVLSRVRGMFDEIVVAIGRNPDKTPLFSMEDRTRMVEEAIREVVDPDSRGIRVESYDGLTVDYARSVNACAMIRGIRNITDLAGESQLAITNRKIAGIETVFIVSGEEHAYTSSSLIRQMAGLGASIDQLGAFVPPVVLEAVRDRQLDPDHPLGSLRSEPASDH